MPDLPHGVTPTKDPGDREAFLVRGPGGTALVATLGAQVLSWTTAGGDVLWCGSKAEYAPGKPVRGGIPLVFPWFGDHPSDKKLPAHGFVRNLPWRVKTTGPGPRLELTIGDDAGTRAMWPHAFALTLTITVTDALRLELTIENPGRAPLRCEEALHTYFAVGDVHRASVHGLQGVACTEHAAAPEGSWDRKAPLQFRAETDRIFQGTPNQLELHAPALRRTITLRSEKARSAIVWNPWPAKTARLSGLAADDWQRFCCIETANVREHAIELPPGGRHTLVLELQRRDG